MTPAGRWVILAGVWLVYVCFGAVTASLAPLVAEIQVDLAIGPAAMGLVMGAWPFVYALTAIPCGLLLDRIGAGPCIALAACAVAVSAAARGLADGPASLVLATAVLGVGGPLVSIGAPKLVSAYFDGRHRGLAMGLYITGPSLGAILAIVLTHPVLLPLAGSWQGVMFLYAGAAALSGVVWLVIAVRCGLHHPTGPVRRKPIASALLRLVRTDGVPRLLVLAVAIFFVNHALNNWLVEVLRARGASPEEAGLHASLPTLVGLAASPILPALAPPARRGVALALLLVCGAAGTVLMLVPVDAVVMTGLALQGLTRGTALTLAMLMLLDLPRVDMDDRGAVGGLFFTAGETGGVLGPAMFGMLAAHDPSFVQSLLLVAAVTAIAIPLARRRT